MGMNDPMAEEPQRIPNGGLVRPGPVAFEVGVQQAPDGTKWVTIRIETESGSFCKPIDADLAASLAKTLGEAAKGAKSKVDVIRNGLVLPPHPG